MAKKKSTRPPNIQLNVRDEAEKEAFRAAATREGFDTMSAWILYHMRKRANNDAGNSSKFLTLEEVKEVIRKAREELEGS